MKKVSVITAAQAAEMIPNNANVALGGFVAGGIPEAIHEAVEQRFLETGAPRDLTLLWIAGCGTRNHTNADHYAHEGMVKKVIGGHFNCAVRHTINEKSYIFRCPLNAVCVILIVVEKLTAFQNSRAVALIIGVV